MRTYYIHYEYKTRYGDVKSTWDIRETQNKLETVKGLLREIKKFKEERRREVVIKFYKRLYDE